MRAFLDLIRDDAGASLAEYAIIAACLALPMLAIGAIIAASAGTSFNSATHNMVNLSLTPP